ncbi:MAG TPA: hypothetical protein VMV82_11290 [Candidatus Dormibacteraeota bacterium]|nr:hypothetical protein [Candidatus Dormibacteraeota bacterium]
MRYYALGMTLFAGIVLLGAVHEASRNATLDTLTVHRINVLDREGKLALVITNHDDFPLPVVNGHTFRRGGGNDTNGILFYNQRGDEQGGLTWTGLRHPDGTFESSNEISFDTVNTDQLLHLQDGNENGRTEAELIGWNQPDYNSPAFMTLLDDIQHMTPAQLHAFAIAHPELRSKTRFLFGYDATNTSQVMLADGQGRPRIKMFVTADGDAHLEFLDATGKIVAEYPETH